MFSATPIYQFLSAHREKSPVSFHMPGHKGAQFYERFGYGDFLRHLVDFDITEIDGADNLFQTEGIIQAVQEKYAALYHCQKSYLMINGTSGGIIASILSCTEKNKKLIMARNSHKSVFNALTLGNIQPLYVYPETLPEYGISGAIPPEEIEALLSAHPDADAVILPSPNYYGICSEIKKIAAIVHHYGKVLIVDEAHGAHLQFSPDLPPSALASGADLVITSTHKTLGSFTQSAALHLNSDRVDQWTLEDKLQCIESTSPSYLLMASLDITAAILHDHGQQLMQDWCGMLTRFYQRAAQIPGLLTMGKRADHDWTKINLSMKALGLSGAELEKRLKEEYQIYMELTTGDLLMGMSGIGNVQEDYDRLAAALEEISVCQLQQRKSEESSAEKQDALTGNELPLTQQPPVLPPAQAEMIGVPKSKQRLPLAQSEGLICASSIIPYPPGIPLLCPGERITAEAISYIQHLRQSGEKVIGVGTQGEITVGQEG